MPPFDARRSSSATDLRTGAAHLARRGRYAWGHGGKPDGTRPSFEEVRVAEDVSFGIRAVIR